MKPYTIEDGVPLTTRGADPDEPMTGLAIVRMAMKEMEVGQSAFFSLEATRYESQVVLQKRMNSAAHWIKRNSPEKRYETRQRTENGEEGVRVWRTN